MKRMKSSGPKELWEAYGQDQKRTRCISRPIVPFYEVKILNGDGKDKKMPDDSCSGIP